MTQQTWDGREMLTGQEELREGMALVRGLQECFPEQMLTDQDVKNEELLIRPGAEAR
jgi:hypothetical protein